MLTPSYSSLIRILNEEVNVDQRITSRYSVVIAAAKRARQIVGGAEYTSFGVTTDKAVSIAVSEIEHGNIRIMPGSVDPWGKASVEQIPQNLANLIDESFVSEDIVPEGEFDEDAAGADVYDDDEDWDDEEDEEDEDEDED